MCSACVLRVVRVCCACLCVCVFYLPPDKPRSAEPGAPGKGPCRSTNVPCQVVKPALPGTAKMESECDTLNDGNCRNGNGSVVASCPPPDLPSANVTFL